MSCVYFNISQIAYTGSRYGDFEGEIGLRGNLLLNRLNAAESVLRGHTGHCRGCFVRCLPTGERIFFLRIKHTRKIVLALRCSYLRFTVIFCSRGIILPFWRLNAIQGIVKALQTILKHIYLPILQPYITSKKESRTHPTLLRRNPQISAAIPIMYCTLHSGNGQAIRKMTINFSSNGECKRFRCCCMRCQGSGEISLPSDFVCTSYIQNL